MICDLSDINISEPTSPGIPGFGPIAPFQIDFPDVALPDGFPEDLLDLIEQFLAIFPSNIFRPNLDNFSKDVVDAIVSLLNQIAPYLGLYKFFIALLNMIICILGVLCTLKNPVATLRALRQLFRRCLPDFLNLFPWLALIAMIIALLLLLLAIIEYIIAQILRLIAEIIRNIKILTDAVSRNDAEKTLAAVRKLASLICLMENLFAILLAFSAVFDILRALAEVQVNSVCGRDGALQGVDVGCCPQDVCPNFIADNDGSFPFSSTGQLIYHKRIEQDTTIFGIPSGTLNLNPERNERYQFIETDTSKTYKFIDIVNEINSVIFFPEDTTFTSDSPLNKVPYTVDMRFFVDAGIISLFGLAGIPRFIQIKDVIVTQKPLFGTLEFDNGIDFSNLTGTLLLTGGTVTEDDGTTEVIINGETATLDTFLTLNKGFGLPTADDGYVIDNISYTFKINEEALVDYGLITIGCTLRADREILNDTLIGNAVAPITLIDFPDLSGAVDCLLNSTRKFRDNLSTSGAADLQADVEACMDDLRDQTLNAYGQAISAGFDRKGSTIEVDPEVQFINSPIKAKVNLKDSAGTTLISNMPESARDDVANRLAATVTLGTIGQFSYDGYEQVFVADINSNIGGNGELRVTFDGETFIDVLGTDNLNDPLTVEERVVTYTFVSSAITDAGDANAGRLPGMRRDEGDVARDESDG